MAIDPKDPNLGASPGRAEELKRANIEGAKFKATMEGLNSVFKDFAKNSQDALKADSEMLAQLDGMGKGFKKAIGLADKLKGFTLNDLKNAKQRNAFQKALNDAQGDQARIAADMAILEDTITQKKAEQAAAKGEAGAKPGFGDEDVDPSKYTDNRKAWVQAQRDANKNPYPHKFNRTHRIDEYVAAFEN